MYSEGCLICGKELIYSDTPERSTCMICKKEFMTGAKCPDGHYVCDSCHEAPAKNVIIRSCLDSDLNDPIELAEQIMKDPTINMHGPEHHLLVGSVLATAYHNCGGKIDLENTIGSICDRMSKVPGGICGNYGCCGSAVSAGTFISVITKATPLTESSWGLSNQMTSECLMAIGKIGGPRCCKRDSFLSIMTASKFVSDNLDVKIDYKKPICSFYERNRQCIGKRCPFHP